MHLNTDLLPMQGAADTSNQAHSPLKNKANSQKKKVDLIHSNHPKQVLYSIKLFMLHLTY
ncbi:hypothetical protein EON65_20180 [archaeon]|nr:MAG: hypothetical protein EON65_20180 [archaeon]